MYIHGNPIQSDGRAELTPYGHGTLTWQSLVGHETPQSRGQPYRQETSRRHARRQSLNGACGQSTHGRNNLPTANEAPKHMSGDWAPSTRTRIDADVEKRTRAMMGCTTSKRRTWQPRPRGPRPSTSRPRQIRTEMNDGPSM
ncbi:hypothetical protein R1flu_016245 [Riccia fluitans]|uniref:Uncharacterized protein n=1 Tax=Riccia fluitans TaxID=41844 RepID=A0ABD1YMB6_9MARC